MKRYFVYIMSNNFGNVLYIGVTGNLQRRVMEHRDGRIEDDSFTHRYNCGKLLYFEEFQTISQAISREKQLKTWHRAWKDDLIRTKKTTFEDLMR